MTHSRITRSVEALTLSQLDAVHQESPCFSSIWGHLTSINQVSDFVEPYYITSYHQFHVSVGLRLHSCSARKIDLTYKAHEGGLLRKVQMKMVLSTPYLLLLVEVRINNTP